MSYVIFNEAMKFNPKNPKWINRDRFVLSAGHASMLQYAMLHLCGYDSVSVRTCHTEWNLGTYLCPFHLSDSRCTSGWRDTSACSSMT